MPFEIMTREHFAPSTPNGQTEIRGWTEGGLQELLCNRFGNQQDWMAKAKQLLWPPDGTCEVSFLQHIMGWHASLLKLALFYATMYHKCLPLCPIDHLHITITQYVYYDRPLHWSSGIKFTL